MNSDELGFFFTITVKINLIEEHECCQWGRKVLNTHTLCLLSRIFR